MALSRGGMQFMLIIWLQGIWLPLHGYSFSQTPLWAGIYLIPLTIGFLLSAPLSGILSDRLGAKAFTVGGALLTAATFLVLRVPAGGLRLLAVRAARRPQRLRHRPVRLAEPRRDDELPCRPTSAAPRAA